MAELLRDQVLFSRIVKNPLDVVLCELLYCACCHSAFFGLDRVELLRSLSQKIGQQKLGELIDVLRNESCLECVQGSRSLNFGLDGAIGNSKVGWRCGTCGGRR